MSGGGSRKALGRGLGALLPPTPGTGGPAAPTTEEGGAPRSGPRTPATLPVEALAPDPDQPRRHFDEAALDELARSIRSKGIVQPIVVTKDPDAPGTYRIVAGERRWRAARRAGLSEVPVVLRDAAPDERLELALVENLQRVDLGPVEEARAYQELLRRLAISQEELARRLGRDRSTIANALRLLKLPDKVLDMLEDGRLSAGHARALLVAPDDATRIELARKAARGKWSVRALERKAREAAAAERAKSHEPADPDAVIVADLERRLSRALQTAVRVRRRRGNPKAGVLEIAYDDLDVLDRILDQLLTPGRGNP